jgi:tungstate transport system substrate-binding protein
MSSTRKWLLSLTMSVALLATLVACSGPAATTTTPPTTSSPSTTTAAPPPTTTTAPATTAPSKPANPEIIMASTTSTRDSGLMDVLIPLFQKQTGYVMKPVYVGSGAAIAQGQSGNADVLLVHSPAAEVTFMNGGYGINRRLVMHNDFIIVGAPSDPAGIAGMTVATDALKKISDAKVNFYSRGDNSGTDALEKALWKKIGINVADNSTTNPSWYIQGGAGTGMLDLLRVVSEKGGYTITDRSTYVANKAILNLSIMVQGDPGLLNVYHVIQVNPDKFPKVNAAGAKAFSDFMVAPDTQAVIASYGKSQYGEPLFFADAGKTEASLGSQ